MFYLPGIVRGAIIQQIKRSIQTYLTVLITFGVSLYSMPGIDIFNE